MNDTLGAPMLAVVIPAYKRDFLAKALGCLVRQTDQRFAIYIGDDGSPFDLAGVCQDALRGRDFHYVRFEANLGGRSLTAHWERCIGLTRHEPWIWLFSDDDMVDVGCVAAFYRLIEQQPETFDVLRFDALTVDGADQVVDIHSIHSNEESWLEFAYLRLRGQRISCMQQVIFSRRAYERVGGFVNLPLAWCSDDATIIAMASEKKIKRIEGPKVYWRRSGTNITASGGLALRKKKIEGICLYLRWLKTRLEENRPKLFDGDQRAFAYAMRGYLYLNLRVEGGLPALLNLPLLRTVFDTIGDGSRLPLYREMAASLVEDWFRLITSLSKRITLRTRSQADSANSSHAGIPDH